MRAREEKLLKELTKKAEETFRKQNFLLLGEFFVCNFYFVKTNKDIYEKTMPYRNFVYAVEKQKELCPLEYKALDFFGTRLITKYYWHYLYIMRRYGKESEITMAGEFLEQAFKKDRLKNPSREALDYLIEYGDKTFKAREIRQKAIEICNNAFLAKCKKLNIARREAIDSMAKFITLFTERISQNDANDYFTALDRQHLKELNY